MKTKPTSVHRFLKKQFPNRWSRWFGLYFILFLLLIALLSPFLANDKPLMIELNGQYYFPAFTHRSVYIIKNETRNDTIIINQTDWKQVKSSFVIRAPIPYSGGKGDLLNGNFASPFGDQKFQEPDGSIIPIPAGFRHWLGTSQRGDDLLAGLIDGTRIALLVGILSMLIASFIGISLGALAGYYGDRSLKISYAELVAFLLLVPISWFYAFTVRALTIQNAFLFSYWEGWFQLLLSLIVFGLILISGVFVAGRITYPSFLRRTFNLPIDILISRFTEIMIALPTFLVILSVAAVATPSIWNVIIIIGLTSWTGISRLTRAEMLRIKNLPFIESARSLGFRDSYIILRHAIPNLLAPVIVNVMFGIANAILIQSALSFLGLGVAPDQVTWGSLLSDGMIDIHAWWMIVFPGLTLFFTIASLNLLGEGLQETRMNAADSPVQTK